MSNFFKSIFISTLSVFVFILFYNFSWASVMSSTHYAIQSDDATVGGGNGATSANYIYGDTMGEVTAGPATSTSFALRAGYQEMQQTYITITPPGDLNMRPDILGITGGTASAPASFSVKTDNEAGFNMSLAASTPIAMMASGDATYYFDNYSSTPTYGWAVATGNAQFGFSVPAQDAITKFRDNGSNACNAAEGSTGNCFAGFPATSSMTVVNYNLRTDSGGRSENIFFQAQSKQKVLESGTYKSSITVTVAAN